MHAIKGISQYCYRAAQLGKRDPAIDRFVFEAVFSTLTNVNFDSARFDEFLTEADATLQKARALYLSACATSGLQPAEPSGPAQWRYKGMASIEKDALEVGVQARVAKHGEDYASVMSIIEYGLKGLCAYAEHARVLGQDDGEVSAGVHECFDVLTRENVPLGDMLGYALKVGTLNLRVMEMLDKGATTRFGNPVPTKVLTSAVKGKCIVVSGHDLADLEAILKQTEGKGINVYTHGELLPAHGYPGLKKYKHLVGNYGGAWMDQKLEFSIFPGPILMTTNCIIEPKRAYRDRIFTTNAVGYEGVTHVTNHNYSAIVERALAMPGFTKDEPEKFTMTGFGHNAVLGVADKLIGAFKSGAVKHAFLIGGCDGSEAERNYFRDLALMTPKDSLILTLACGKYRFNKHFERLGDIGGIPRMIDIGQCNDAYSAVVIASALAKAFHTDVNGLPLSFHVSWLEQKAVAVLLTLLSLGIKDIHLGPSLPAFVTPNVLNILVEKFAVRPIGDPAEDMQRVMNKGK
jgi:hydroxylamine reductase